MLLNPSITVQNNSRITAQNIVATLPASWTDVTQDASACVSLPPGAVCRIVFTPGTTAHAPQTIPVSGSNTSTVSYTMSVAATVGGTVSGLTGVVVLQNNGGDNLTISANGPFTFPTPVIPGNTYSVTVQNQPIAQLCTVTNGTGIISTSNITNVVVNCSVVNTTITVSATGVIPVNNGFGSLTVTNTGSAPALNVAASTPEPWTAVIQNASACTLIEPGHSCNLNFSSIIPYLAQGNIIVSGNNIASPPTTALAFSVNGYLVWEITDASTVQVIDSEDLALPYPDGIDWGGFGTAIGISAQSLTDGAGNTSSIVATLGTGSSYAAELCNQSTNGSASIGDWYLPAICQTGGEGQGAGCASGLANIDINLVQLGFGNLAGFFWSSTEGSYDPTVNAWYQNFAVGSSNQNGDGGNSKGLPLGVRCARALIY